jgi:hypothetical protein
MSSPYLSYTQYYLISGAYHIINIVNGILTYSASYSDNMKEYLRNQVALKQVVLSELIRNENNARTNVNQNDKDIDEDGFVVIKMKRQKKNKNEYCDSNGINGNGINGNGINGNGGNGINGNGINGNGINGNGINGNGINIVHDNINNYESKILKDDNDNIHSDIIQQVVEEIIKNVINN